jgi:LmbE family N-acetylglucosaminyl deacetylase
MPKWRRLNAIDEGASVGSSLRLRSAALTLVAVSPHLDDVVLSAARTVLAWRGPRIIATVFSGDPVGELSSAASAFHADCGLGNDAMAHRRNEDEAACAILDCEPLHLGLLEALYRRDAFEEPVVTDELQLFEHDVLAVLADEADLVEIVADALTRALTYHGDAAVFAPLGTGRHRDHVVVRAAVERICAPFGYYDDQPYGWWGRPPAPPPPLRYRRREFLLTRGEWERKRRALACYGSQMTMLWGPHWADPVDSAPDWRTEARAEALWVTV